MKYGEYIFGSTGEKLSLSAQFIAFEYLQPVDFSALWLEVKKHVKLLFVCLETNKDI